MRKGSPHRKRNIILAVLVVVALITAVVVGTLQFIPYQRHVQVARDFNRITASPRYPVSPNLAIQVLGMDEGKKFLRKMANQYGVFYFDGNSRFCQIIPGYREYKDYNMRADGIRLTLVDVRSGESPSHTWAGPPGAHIESIEFQGDTLRVTCRRKQVASNDEPEKRKRKEAFVIPWKPNEVPHPPTVNLE